MKKLLVTMLLCGMLPVAAYAGTCASPTTIFSNTTVSGSTCGGEPGGINMGGAVYPHPSQVYSFVAQSPNGEILLDAGSTNIEMSLTTSCTNAPLDVGVPGATPNGITVNSLTNGTTYLLIVSTDPSIPTSGTPLCNNFTANIPTVPVTLQKFSIE